MRAFERRKNYLDIERGSLEERERERYIAREIYQESVQGQSKERLRKRDQEWRKRREEEIETEREGD